ncbi:hypothetical protein [Mesorhizobium sp.]|jgi:hypothetical protein
MSSYDMMVITAVLVYFGSFSAVLAYATLEESRHRPSRSKLGVTR